MVSEEPYKAPILYSQDNDSEYGAKETRWKWTTRKKVLKLVAH